MQKGNLQLLKSAGAWIEGQTRPEISQLRFYGAWESQASQALAFIPGLVHVSTQLSLPCVHFA